MRERFARKKSIDIKLKEEAFHRQLQKLHDNNDYGTGPTSLFQNAGFASNYSKLFKKLVQYQH